MKEPRNSVSLPPKTVIPDNQCPGCGNLHTLAHARLWKYYCAVCDWGFGHPTSPRNYENERHE